MRLYVRENRFAQATYRSFAAALSEAFGRDVTDALIHHLYSIDEYAQESLLTRRRGLRTLRRKYFAASARFDRRQTRLLPYAQTFRSRLVNRISPALPQKDMRPKGATAGIKTRSGR